MSKKKPRPTPVPAERIAGLIDAYGTDLVVTSPDREMYTAPLVVVDTRFEDEETGKLTTFIEQFLGE